MTYYLISFFTMVQDDKQITIIYFKQELKEHSNEIINN